MIYSEEVPRNPKMPPTHFYQNLRRVYDDLLLMYSSLFFTVYFSLTIREMAIDGLAVVVSTSRKRSFSEKGNLIGLKIELVGDLLALMRKNGIKYSRLCVL